MTNYSSLDDLVMSGGLTALRDHSPLGVTLEYVPAETLADTGFDVVFHAEAPVCRVRVELTHVPQLFEYTLPSFGIQLDFEAQRVPAALLQYAERLLAMPPEACCYHNFVGGDDRFTELIPWFFTKEPNFPEHWVTWQGEADGH